MNYAALIEQGVGMLGGGIAGAVLGSGNLPPPPVIVKPAPDYTPLYVAGFAGLVALILWK